MSIAKILHSLRNHAETPTRRDTDTVRKIVHALEQMEPRQARYTAAYAYILARVANADMNISEAETQEMEALVSRLSGLPEEQAILVVQIAKTQTVLFGGTENFLVTEEFNRMATEDQKLSLLNCLFGVAAADKSISGVEDREIRLIADELQLRHDQYIDVRLQYRNYLSVLNGAS
ncbi:MAG TPA: TerB family tellurite resistance protein [Terriglobales bacterium]|nr:TerB family tellurite resistance protein [Terriglobales bacterium]